jgi:hypothetical protein
LVEYVYCKGENHLRGKITENNISEQVRIFNNVGCNISYLCSQDPEIKVQKYLQLIGTIKRMLLHKVRIDTISKFYKTVVRPLLLYGSEIWILTTTRYRRYEAAEMQLSRPLVGDLLLDQKRNNIQYELDIPPVTEILASYRMAWYEHLQRISIYHIPKRPPNYRPAGRRSIGHSRIRWSDQFSTWRWNRPKGLMHEVVMMMMMIMYILQVYFNTFLFHNCFPNYPKMSQVFAENIINPSLFRIIFFSSILLALT